MFASLYAKAACLVLILVVLGGLWMHDRMLSARLSAAKVQLSVLQENNNVLSSKLAEQSAAVAALHAATVAYQQRVGQAMQDAASVRAARASDEKRIAALQVPTKCEDALSYLVRYWQLPVAPPPSSTTR